MVDHQQLGHFYVTPTTYTACGRPIVQYMYTAPTYVCTYVDHSITIALILLLYRGSLTPTQMRPANWDTFTLRVLHILDVDVLLSSTCTQPLCRPLHRTCIHSVTIQRFTNIHTNEAKICSSALHTISSRHTYVHTYMYNVLLHTYSGIIRIYNFNCNNNYKISIIITYVILLCTYIRINVVL